MLFRSGMVNLQGLHELRHLWLSTPQVTDAAVPHLMGLKNLEFLTLEGAQISEAGIAALKRAIPNLTISE